jgi:hypothetical protein
VLQLALVTAVEPLSIRSPLSSFARFVLVYFLMESYSFLRRNCLFDYYAFAVSGPPHFEDARGL